MRRYLLLPVMAAALVMGPARIAGADGGEGPITVGFPAVEFRLNGGFAPKKLSRTEPAPISVALGSEITDSAYGHPPALRELTIEFDRAIEIDTDGIPSCPRKRLGRMSKPRRRWGPADPP